MTTSTTDAHFSPKLKTYYFLHGVALLTVSIFGIVLLPVWAIVGPWWAKRAYEALKLEVTDRRVVIKKGVMFHQELSIPLDKIQDISIHEGPLLKSLGLLGLRIETAGQRNATTGKPEADLVGVMNARTVRDQILALRDAQAAAVISGAPLAANPATGQDTVLTEIRDSLLRIEAQLAARSAKP